MSDSGNQNNKLSPSRGPDACPAQGVLSHNGSQQGSDSGRRSSAGRRRLTPKRTACPHSGRSCAASLRTPVERARTRPLGSDGSWRQEPVIAAGPVQQGRPGTDARVRIGFIQRLIHSDQIHLSEAAVAGGDTRRPLFRRRLGRLSARRTTGLRDAGLARRRRRAARHTSFRLPGVGGCLDRLCAGCSIRRPRTVRGFRSACTQRVDREHRPRRRGTGGGRGVAHQAVCWLSQPPATCRGHPALHDSWRAAELSDRSHLGCHDSAPRGTDVRRRRRLQLVDLVGR